MERAFHWLPLAERASVQGSSSHGPLPTRKCIAARFQLVEYISRTPSVRPSPPFSCGAAAVAWTHTAPRATQTGFSFEKNLSNRKTSVLLWRWQPPPSLTRSTGIQYGLQPTGSLGKRALHVIPAAAGGPKRLQVVSATRTKALACERTHH